jgi:Family of unknown function (DUF5991)
MKLLRYMVLGIGLMASACMANDPVSPWLGEYQFEGHGGNTAGGSPIMMEITLTISKPGSNDSCKLHMQGFQKDETIFCTTTGTDSKLDVRFKTYDDGRIVNAYDVARYKVSEVLFSLEKTDGKDKKTRYVPHWAAYVPFDNMDIGGKYYFKKTK